MLGCLKRLPFAERTQLLCDLCARPCTHRRACVWLCEGEIICGCTRRTVTPISRNNMWRWRCGGGVFSTTVSRFRTEGEMLKTPSKRLKRPTCVQALLSFGSWPWLIWIQVHGWCWSAHGVSLRGPTAVAPGQTTFGARVIACDGKRTMAGATEESDEKADSRSPVAVFSVV